MVTAELVGEVFLEACRVFREECWRERAADIADVLAALFHSRSRGHYSPDELAADADGLMLGTAGILHFQVRHHHPAAVASAPLLGESRPGRPHRLCDERRAKKSQLGQNSLRISRPSIRNVASEA
jgi:hypothetical protein